MATTERQRGVGAREAETDEEGTVELFAIDPGLEQP